MIDAAGASRIMHAVEIGPTMSADDAVRALTDVLRGPEGGLTPDGMRRLTELRSLPGSTRPAALATINGYVDTSSLATSLELRRPSSEWGGWDAWDELRGQVLYADADAAAARWDELLDIPNHRLSRADLHDMNALSLLPRGGARPRSMQPYNPAFAKVAEMLDAPPDEVARSSVWEVLNEVRGIRAWPTMEERAAALGRLLETPPTSWDIATWERASWMSRVRETPDDPLLREYARSVNTGTLVRERAAGLVDGTDPWGWSRLAKLHATRVHHTAQDARAALERVLGDGSVPLSNAQLHELDGLAQLPDGIRPFTVPALDESHDPVFVLAAINPTHEGYARAAADALAGIRAVATLPDDVAARTQALGSMRDEAWTELRAIADAADGDVTVDQLRRLGRLVALPPDIRPAVLDSVDQSASSLAKASGDRPYVAHATRRVLDNLRMRDAFPTRESAERRLSELLDTDHATLDPNDLLDLDAIGRLDGARRPRLLASVVMPDMWAAANWIRSGKQLDPEWFLGLDDLRAVRDLPAEPAARADAVAAIRAEHTSRLRDVMSRPNGEMTRQDWTTLLRVARLPDEVRPIAISGGAEEVAALTEGSSRFLGKERPSATWRGWSLLNGTRAQATIGSRDAAEAVLDDVLRTENAKLDRDQVHAISGLRMLPDQYRPEAIDRWGVDDAVELAESLPKRRDADLPALQALDDLRLLVAAPGAPSDRAAFIRELFAAGPERIALLDAIVARGRTDVPSELDAAANLFDASRRLRATTGWPGGDRYVPPLEFARDTLDRATVPSAVDALRGSTRDLVASNLDRATRGGRYVDWAELGRIDSTLRLLASLEQATAPVARVADDTISW